MINIIHTSDWHIADAGHPYTAEDAREIIAAIKENENPSSTVIVDTGDWTGSGFRRQLSSVEPIWKELAECGTLVMTTANHDVGLGGQIRTPSVVRRLLAQMEKITNHDMSEFPYTVDVRGVRFIIMDTCARNTIVARGALGDEQIERISCEVKQSRAEGMLIVLVGHHCPSGGSPALRLRDRHQLGEALESAGGVDLWLSGHLHRGAEWRNVFGADWLMASPMVTKEKKYRRIHRDAGGWRWEWVSV